MLMEREVLSNFPHPIPHGGTVVRGIGAEMPELLGIFFVSNQATPITPVMGAK